MAEKEYWLGPLRLFLKSLKTKHHGSYLVWFLKIQILTEGSFPKDASSFCSNPSSRNTAVSDVGSSTDQAHKLQAALCPLPGVHWSWGWRGLQGGREMLKCPKELQSHMPNPAFYWERERVTSLLTSPSPLPLPQNGQMWLCKKLITDGGKKKKKKGNPPLSTTRLFPLQTWGWMGRPGKTGRWKTHYRCEVWRIRLKDNLRVVNFNFGGLNALLSNTKQIGNKKPHERDA